MTKGTLAMYTSPRRRGPLSNPVHHCVLIIHVKSDHLLGSKLCHAMPDGLANASRSHSKLRTRSPLSEDLSTRNPPLMPISARNRPPFTCVHSHAAAQKLSGAFFLRYGQGKCRKQAGGRRNALRASRAVRARDVMVNSFYNILINLNRFQNEYYCL